MKIFWFITSNKTLVDSKPLLIRFDKMDLLEFMMQLDI